MSESNNEDIFYSSDVLPDKSKGELTNDFRID